MPSQSGGPSPFCCLRPQAKECPAKECPVMWQSRNANNIPGRQTKNALAEPRRFLKSGWGGIRTHGRVSPTLVFKTRAFVHSATHPVGLFALNDRNANLVCHHHRSHAWTTSCATQSWPVAASFNESRSAATGFLSASKSLIRNSVTAK